MTKAVLIIMKHLVLGGTTDLTQDNLIVGKNFLLNFNKVSCFVGNQCNSILDDLMNLGSKTVAYVRLHSDDNRMQIKVATRKLKFN